MTTVGNFKNTNAFLETHKDFQKIDFSDQEAILDNDDLKIIREHCDVVTDTKDKKTSLPQGIWRVNDPIDNDKKTIVISLTEDNDLHMSNILAGLDKYFKLPVGKKLKQKYNILVAFSTSAFDMLKTLKKAKAILQDKFAEANFLFLNDTTINLGTDKIFETKKGDGTIIPKMAQEFIGNRAIIRTLEQKENIMTSEQEKIKNKAHPYNWLNKKDREEAITAILNEFKQNQTPATGKLALGINNFFTSPIKSLAGIHVPIQAFVRFLEEQES